MCGIFGFFNKTKKEFSLNSSPFHVLMKESYSRGKEASGVTTLTENNQISYIKSDLDGRKLFKTNEYQEYLSSLHNQTTIASFGHSRLATHGSQLDPLNNQPVISSKKTKIAIHNGIITNPDILWNMTGNVAPPPTLDTQSLIDYYEFLVAGSTKEVALKKLFEDIEGSASISILDPNEKSLVLATNTGSLYYLFSNDGETMFFASESIYLKKILGFMHLQEESICHLKPGSALLITQDVFRKFKFDDILENPEGLNGSGKNYVNGTVFKDLSHFKSVSKAKDLYKVTNKLESLKKHDFDYDRIYAIKRCSKCILPASTPFIEFDNRGVCNFCNEHIPISNLGMNELEKVIKKYRKGNSEPDCLAAFSGGRDSSYGLHYLKKELGLQPLAYTYDWGMVTNMARKNQARILGKLGVEHIVVSADITTKRRHIKENILAWMKDPHLGMVPLFMEGDKQCEFYADQIMKKYKLNLMFFFRGNELEKDEFKTGHCGVKDADPGGVIHNLAPFKKVKLLTFYACRYFKNPAYFNSSFFDTSLGFFSTYIQKHNYLYLWHYVPWKEQVILDTLRNEYNWETTNETKSTWRTDDGTSAFYNYIYYQVQGFTENDSFRSRQIREGLIERETALELVHEENKPRYQALQWYFDMVGLDGDEVLTVVDSMKRLY